MVINISKIKDWFLSWFYAPWLFTNYLYNKQVDEIFKQIDFDLVSLVKMDDHNCQIFDIKNGLFIKFWSNNIPYAVACEGMISFSKINMFGVNNQLVFNWERLYRPSKYQMGRISRYICLQKTKDDAAASDVKEINISGNLTSFNGKFYERVELSKEEWEAKYALFLLKNL